MMEVNRCNLKRMTDIKYVEQKDTYMRANDRWGDGTATYVLGHTGKDIYISYIVGLYQRDLDIINEPEISTVLHFFDETNTKEQLCVRFFRDGYSTNADPSSTARRGDKNFIAFPSDKFYKHEGDNKFIIHCVDDEDGIHVDFQVNESGILHQDFLGKHGFLRSVRFNFLTRLSDIIVSDFEQKMADYLVDIPVVSIDGWTKETDGSYSTDKMNVPLTFSFDREALQKIEKENTLKACYLQADTTIRGDNMKNFVLNVGGETVTQAVGSQTTNVSFGTALSDIQKFTSTAPTLTVTG